MVSAPLCLAAQHAFINFICIQLLPIFSSFLCGWDVRLVRHYCDRACLTVPLARAPWWCGLCGLGALFESCLAHFPTAETSTFLISIAVVVSHTRTQASLALL